MGLTGIEGSQPEGLAFEEKGYSGPTPQRTVRVPAAQLRDDPRAVTLMLIRRFLDTIRGTSYTPFAS